MSDLKDELRQERREKEWAETWKPDGPGDMLIGTLEAYDEATTDFGTYTVAHIRDEEGVLRGLWLMHSVLQDEWKEAAPEVGERVGVQYLGQRSGSDFDYHMWTVKVDREAAAGETAEDRAPQESDTAGAEATANRQPQGARSTAGADTEGAAPEGKPDGREQARQIYGGGEESDTEPALDDPNEELPF